MADTLRTGKTKYGLPYIQSGSDGHSASVFYIEHYYGIDNGQIVIETTVDGNFSGPRLECSILDFLDSLGITPRPAQRDHAGMNDEAVAAFCADNTVDTPMKDTRPLLGRSPLSQDEIDQSYRTFWADQTVDPSADLSNAAIEQMRRVAAVSLHLEPLPPGNNDGLVYFKRRNADEAPFVAVDTVGNEAFAEFISNARDWVMLLSSELLRIREGLAPILQDKHFEPCHRVGGESERCECHYWMAKDALDPLV